MLPLPAMSKILCCLTTATALLLTVPLGMRAADPDTFSPVVSYQYEDSLADPVTQPSIISPVVAYQYFDWPGDENLTFQYSPTVSYFYYFTGGLTLTGTVSTPTGTPVPGAQITFKRVNAPFSLATSNANGIFTTPGLPTPANYTLTVTKPGYVTKITNLALTGAGNQSFNLQLTPLPSAPTTVATNRNVAPTTVRPPAPTDPINPNSPRLKIFNGTAFVDLSGPLDKNRATIVFSHGWNSSPGDWATLLAYQIKSRLGNATPNLLVWDWHIQANTTYPPTDEALAEGLRLGQALQQQLGTNYNQHIHFIGHSLGTIVNAQACDYVHGSFARSSMNPPVRWLASTTTPHITLLDEAEVASIFQQQVVTAADVAWQIAQLENSYLTAAAAGGVVGTTIATWKNPIPKDARWIDNYISAVGLKHAQSVNVVLLAPALSLQAQTLQSLKSSVAFAHSYAHEWYSNSVPPATPAAPIGFISSMESGSMFPPSGQGKTPGSLWWENTDSPDPNDLSLYPPNFSGVFPIAFDGNFPIALGLSVHLGSLGGLGIHWAEVQAGTVISTTGNVIGQTLQKVGLWWDVASDAAVDVLNSVNPDQQIAGPLAAPVFGIQLQTRLASRPNSGRNSALAAAGTPGQPAAAWVTVKVPADAGLMAFDFTVTGDPQEDSIACAINDQNVFTLPAKFAPDGQAVSTDMIDVSAYAGQSVELFFGLVGGTSTNCQVSVDGVRFITVPQPQLAISLAAGNTVLQWPASATGWVLETSESLTTGNWQAVPTDSAVTVSNGLAILQQPTTGKQKFYRLRRGP